MEYLLALRINVQKGGQEKKKKIEITSKKKITLYIRRRSRHRHLYRIQIVVGGFFGYALYDFHFTNDSHQKSFFAYLRFILTSCARP